MVIKGAAGPNYLNAAKNVVLVGQRIASFIKTAGINPANVHCIGHSLGTLIISQFSKQNITNLIN